MNAGFGVKVIEISGSGGLGFYGHATTAQQSSSGVTTVAGVLTILQNLGLVN